MHHHMWWGRPQQSWGPQAGWPMRMCMNVWAWILLHVGDGHARAITTGGAARAQLQHISTGAMHEIIHSDQTACAVHDLRASRIPTLTIGARPKAKAAGSGRAQMCSA